jgi:hypothetical protein
MLLAARFASLRINLNELLTDDKRCGDAADRHGVNDPNVAGINLAPIELLARMIRGETAIEVHPFRSKGNKTWVLMKR